MPSDPITEAVAAWFEKTDPACPICKNKIWTTGALFQLESGSLTLPLIPLTCRHCYHVAFFSANLVTGTDLSR